MRPGIGFPSYMATAALSGGAWSADYPLTNAADLVRITAQARSATAGAAQIWSRLAAPSLIGLVAVLGHTLPADGVMRVRVYADGAYDPSRTSVYDSGPMAVWPAGVVQGYRSLFAAAPAGGVTGQMVLVDLSTASGGVVALDGLEVAGWFDLPIGDDRQFGFSDRDDPESLAGGAVDPTPTWSPRMLSAEVPALAVSVSTTTGLDFQKVTDLRKPFVWLQDADSPASWPRTAMLARNQQLPRFVGSLYHRDQAPLRLIEHAR